MASPTLLDNKVMPGSKKKAFMKPDSKRAQRKLGNPGKKETQMRTRSAKEVRKGLYGSEE